VDQQYRVNVHHTELLVTGSVFVIMTLSMRSAGPAYREKGAPTVAGNNSTSLELFFLRFACLPDGRLAVLPLQATDYFSSVIH
jgi:hypothetical protein